MRLLIVEDDQDLCAVLAEILESSGYAVLRCHSVREAKTVLDRETDIPLVLSDYLLGDGTGLDLLDFIQRACPRRPAFFLLSGISLIGAEELAAAGGQRFFAKPYEIPELLDAVESYCTAATAR